MTKEQIKTTQARTKIKIMPTKELNLGRLSSNIQDCLGINGRFGKLLLFNTENNGLIIVENVRRNDKKLRAPGLWLKGFNGSENTLTPTVVVFDSKNKLTTFIYPGPNKKTVSGLRIDRNLVAKEIEGPKNKFSNAIKSAKEIASAISSTM